MNKKLLLMIVISFVGNSGVLAGDESNRYIPNDAADLDYDPFSMSTVNTDHLQPSLIIDTAVSPRYASETRVAQLTDGDSKENVAFMSESQSPRKQKINQALFLLQEARIQGAKENDRNLDETLNAIIILASQIKNQGDDFSSAAYYDVSDVQANVRFRLFVDATIVEPCRAPLQEVEKSKKHATGLALLVVKGVQRKLKKSVRSQEYDPELAAMKEAEATFAVARSSSAVPVTAASSAPLSLNQSNTGSRS